MSKQRFAAQPARTLIAFALLLMSPAFCRAQGIGAQPVHFDVTEASQRLEMTVNTSRILTLKDDVPRMLVNNPEIVKATPLSPNQIQISALKPGVTQLNMWTAGKQVRSVDVMVYGDARELQHLLSSEFPDAELRIRPLANSVVISGYVPSASMVSSIVRMSEDYYPNVINNITIGGVQTVLLHTKVLEVSRTKMRSMGFDWALLANDAFITQRVSGLLGSVAAGVASGSGQETVNFGVLGSNSNFFGFVDLLQQKNLVKVLAEPTLVTVSGRPASFSSGGEFPVMVPQSLGTVSVEFRQFGTRVDYVPIVLGNGSVRLEVRPTVSEIDPTRSVTFNGATVPGLRTRWVDTAVEMKAGQTLALAGLIQHKIESESRGLPVLGDLPWVGAAFRRVQETNNEIELLILVTPEFVDGMAPHEVPKCLPGQSTVSPTMKELFGKGYLEVPNCNGNCPPVPYGPTGGFGVEGFEQLEEVQPGSVVPTPMTEPVQRNAPSAYNSSRRPNDYRAAQARQPARTQPVQYQVGDQNSQYRGSVGDMPTRATGPRPARAYSAQPAEQSQADQPGPALIGPVGYESLGR